MTLRPAYMEHFSDITELKRGAVAWGIPQQHPRSLMPWGGGGGGMRGGEKGYHEFP